MDRPLIFQGGYCRQLERISNKNGAFKMIKFPALFFLLNHPEKGYILFDTGYSHHFMDAVKKFPNIIYSLLTPVSFKEENSALSQLEKRGIRAEDIRYVFISHFHADHIAGLSDFKKATFICSKKAYESIQGKKGFSALRQAFIPELIPADFYSRVQFIEDSQLLNPKTNLLNDFCSIFGDVYDLFGDNVFLSVDLTGHASGQYGLLFNGEKPTFFIADACWNKDCYRRKSFPSRLAHLIMNDPEMYKTNVDKIHQFYTLYPEMEIIPSHCSLSHTDGEGFHD